MYEWEYKFRIPIYHLQYENFIENFDNETKLLFKHLNLNWHQSLRVINLKDEIISKTASTMQIRDPIYNQVSKDYEDLSKFIVKNLEQYDWYHHNKI